MEQPVYGVLSNNVHVDVSTTLRGAKNFATRNEYIVVTKRIGYNACKVAKKLNGKWETL